MAWRFAERARSAGAQQAEHQQDDTRPDDEQKPRIARDHLLGHVPRVCNRGEHPADLIEKCAQAHDANRPRKSSEIGWSACRAAPSIPPLGYTEQAGRTGETPMRR